MEIRVMSISISRSECSTSPLRYCMNCLNFPSLRIFCIFGQTFFPPFFTLLFKRLFAKLCSSFSSITVASEVRDDHGIVFKLPSEIDFFSPLNRPERLWVSSRLLSNRRWIIFTEGMAAKAWKFLRQYISGFKNALSCFFTLTSS